MTSVIKVTGWILSAIFIITVYAELPETRPALTGLILIVMLGMILHGEPQFVASIKSLAVKEK